MQRIAKYLALASILNLGAIAQIIVQGPPDGYVHGGRVVKPSARVQGKNPPLSAVVLHTEGAAKYSIDGKKFRDLKPNAELPRKTIIRTGPSGHTELFVKRMGATLRIEPDSEVALERSKPTGKGEHQELTTKVTIRKGKAVTVVHANVPGSSLEVKNVAGKSISEPVLGSRYVVSADAIENAGSGAISTADSNPQVAAAIKEQMEFDEIQALAETWGKDENPGLQN